MYQHPVFKALLQLLFTNSKGKSAQGDPSILGWRFLNAVPTIPLKTIAMLAAAVSPFLRSCYLSGLLKLISQVYRGIQTWKRGEYIKDTANSTELEKEYRRRLRCINRLTKGTHAAQLIAYQAELYAAARWVHVAQS
jgi:hypothetical protein